MDKILTRIRDAKKKSNFLKHVQIRNVINDNIFNLEKIVSQIKMNINVEIYLTTLNNDFFQKFNRDMCDCFLYLFVVEKENQVDRKKNTEVLFNIINIFYNIIDSVNKYLGYKTPAYEFNKCDGDLFIEDNIFDFFINECKNSDEGSRYNFCTRFDKYKSLKVDLDTLFMSKNLKSYNYIQITEKIDILDRYFSDIISDMFKYVFLNYKSYSNNKIMCVVSFADQQLQVIYQLRSHITNLSLQKKPQASFNVLYN